MDAMNTAMAALFGIVLGLLAVATVTGQIFKRQPESGLNPNV